MSIFINESILNEVSTSEKRYYRLTFKNMDGETVYPSVPKNYFTKNGYEDGVTKRICFAPDIGKCLMAMSMKCTDMECFVMIPDGKYEVYKPSVKEVPDSKITGEVWIKEPVKLKCIGKIKCTGDAGKDGHEFTYGDGKKAELYDWNWEWIERKDKPIHENLINQWWDRTSEARLRDRHTREEKEAKKKEEQEAAKHDESHLKEHGLITQKEFDQCFAIAKKEFLSHRKLSYNSSFKPNNYKYYKYDKNDFIRFIVTEYKDYFKSEDEEVWKAGMKEFKKMIKKVVDKINLGIKDVGLEGITFYSEDLHEAMYFYLESDRPKQIKENKAMAIFNEKYLAEAFGALMNGSHSAVSAVSYCGKEAYDRYIRKYDEFVQFLVNPHKLPKGLLWSGTINSICKIIGMDSDTFNEIVAENIKPTSSELKEDKIEDEKFRKEVFDKIGDKNYVLEEESDRYIVYSVKEKKMFWIDTDNNKFDEFPKTYSSIDKGFVDALWDNPESKENLKILFKEYDSRKGYNLIK